VSPTVLVERQGNLAHLILNRPEVLNAIDNTLGEELGFRVTTRISGSSDASVGGVSVAG